MPDHEARFQQAYDAYSGLIFAYAAARVANTDDAADVVADTFVVAWRRINDMPQGEDARPWLYGVARKVLANYRRTERRRRQLGSKVASEVSSMVSHSMLAHEGPEIDVIAEAFASLAPSDQEILTLVGWEDMEPADLPMVLECTPVAARVRLHRARRRFRRALDASEVKQMRTSGHDYGRWVSAHSDPEEV